tara:strand:- start:62 stop:367 length:306 start_codon:yes stop_codon:yes gene_type:complete
MIQWGKAAFSGVKAWGKKVGPKAWSATKEAPGKAKKVATDTFSKFHQSQTYEKASRAIHEMGAKSFTGRDVAKKLTSKAAIGIGAGVGGYYVGKSRKKKHG